MRVVHIIKATGIAGAERHLLTLLPGLRQHHFDVRLILMHNPGQPLDDYAALMEARGVPVERVAIARHTDISVIRRLRDQLQFDQPDIVHTHLLHADLYGALAARWARVRHLVQSRHNDDPFRRRLPIRLINRLIWTLCEAGVGISESVTRFTISVEGAPPRKMRTIHYGMELPVPPIDRAAAQRELREQLGIDTDAVLIGMVGRLIEQKGFRYGIQAFARIAEEFPQARLVVVGDGQQRPMLEGETRRAGVSKRVNFLGWRDDSAALMAALDIFLMPSLWEGFGLVLLEAMARAVPVIGSAVSAIPEVVVHGETGLLVPPADVDALAEALRLLLGDAALRRHMGLLGEARLEDVFSAEQMVAEYARLYRQLAEAAVR